LKIDLDAEGRVSGAHVVENTESHQIIEEFMLAANEAVAAGFGRPRVVLPAADSRFARSAEAANADRVRARTGDRVREPGKPL
jgi:hypothetical protein